MSGETFKCPRRSETGGVFNYPEDDQWRKDDTCSYCGSISPAAFFAAVDTGAELGPTDKSYKVYVKTEDQHGKFYFQHLDDDGRKRFIQLHNDGKLNVGYPGRFYTTPFFTRTVSHDYDGLPDSASPEHPA